MHAYWCSEFTGHYPVGTAAVVVDVNAEYAAQALNVELRKQGLPGDAKASDMRKIGRTPSVSIINNGDY